jgi:putative hydrolases of HD superfamily
MPIDPLDQRLAFLREIDGLKSVLRQSPLLDRSRKENSAEHSWHVALYALLLHDLAGGPVSPARVIQMLLIHDIVEVDAGDTLIHAGLPPQEQAEREARAAERLFGILPGPQGDALLALWREFEAAETADATFAKALDRVQPLIANVAAGGGTWIENRLSLEDVLARYGPTIACGSPRLWVACEALVRSHFSAVPDASLEAEP